MPAGDLEQMRCEVSSPVTAAPPFNRRLHQALPAGQSSACPIGHLSRYEIFSEFPERGYVPKIVMGKFDSRCVPDRQVKRRVARREQELREVAKLPVEASRCLVGCA